MKKIVDISRLEFRYKKQTKLLSNLKLNLSTGSIIGLLGKNGEGKTTLLKLICGLRFPIEGNILVNGYSPRKRKPAMLENIFLLPEELQVTNLSIKMYHDVYASFYPDFSDTKFHEYLNIFNIDVGISSISNLSYGQKKKFFIAFGLATNAKLILLDEPTNGLDIPSKRQFRRLMAEAINENCCILISTHQVVDLEDIIDNVIILENHEIVFNYSINTICNKLLFKTSVDKALNNDIIYSEKTTNSYHQIVENKLCEKSNIDLELLFNAVMTDSQRIKDLLNS